MIIRDAAEADLPAIIEIYNAATATRTSTALFEPVSVEERLAWFRRHSPDEFPLPADPKCQERAFFAAFATLPHGQLRRIAKDAAKLLRQPLATRRQALGDAAELDALFLRRKCGCVR